MSVRMALFLAALVSAVFLGNCSASSNSAAAEKPKIRLMTSLPIVWGEAASMENILSGESSPAPIYSYWQERYVLEAVDSLEALEGSDTDIVILAQPRAMDPADLAALDAWVRGGGDTIILTDPMLVWPTDLSLGDSRRPLASGLLSPLLNHWQLELLASEDDGTDVVELGFQDFAISTVGVGSFQKKSSATDGDVDCKLSDSNIIAHCQVGEGRATLVADADFLHQALWADDPSSENGKSGDVMRFTDKLIAAHHDTG